MDFGFWGIYLGFWAKGRANIINVWILEGGIPKSFFETRDSVFFGGTRVVGLKCKRSVGVNNVSVEFTR